MRSTGALRSVFFTLTLGCVTAGTPSSYSAVTDPEAAWARVLERHVSAAGAIDFSAVRQNPADLEAYVAWAARTGPRTDEARYSDRPTQLAWYLNTYNALAMWNVVAGPWEPAQKVRFFFLTRLPIDGGRSSLYTLENGVIRPYGDPRIHFALNCMVRSCPRLPREPWISSRLDAQLDAAAREFVNAPRNVLVVPERKTVRLSSIFAFYTSDFLAVSPSLLAYVNRHRAEPVPEEYAVEFIPYDWTLHQT